jgi:hypothetical protein
MLQYRYPLHHSQLWTDSHDLFSRIIQAASGHLIGLRGPNGARGLHEMPTLDSKASPKSVSWDWVTYDLSVSRLTAELIQRDRPTPLGTSPAASVLPLLNR